MILRFVTGNPGKAAELRQILAPLGWEVEQEARDYPEIQAATLEEVARAGAETLLVDGVAPPFLLEDSGLFVPALDGFPGVYSRWALDTIGCAGMLRLLADEEDRRAEFRAHLLLAEPDGTLCGFDGVCRGTIAPQARGGGGFGFDPIFAPEGDGEHRTFAEMAPLEKGRLSHRGQAAGRLVAYLEESAKT